MVCAHEDSQSFDVNDVGLQALTTILNSSDYNVVDKMAIKDSNTINYPHLPHSAQLPHLPH